jgi:hypothetical protein
MRQILSTALVALVVAALTAVSVSALAQSEPATDSTTISPTAVSNINADKVDGKHAVGAEATILKRRGKLVATDKTGFLPSNIVKPQWKLIKGKPAGFADGVDDGVTGLHVTQANGAKGAAFGPGDFGFAPLATCPAGSVIVGGGAAVSGITNGSTLLVSRPDIGTNGWTSLAQKDESGIGTSSTLQNYALCLSVESGGPITTARKGTAARTRALVR